MIHITENLQNLLLQQKFSKLDLHKARTFTAYRVHNLCV